MPSIGLTVTSDMDADPAELAFRVASFRSLGLEAEVVRLPRWGNVDAATASKFDGFVDYHGLTNCFAGGMPSRFAFAKGTGREAVAEAVNRLDLAAIQGATRCLVTIAADENLNMGDVEAIVTAVQRASQTTALPLWYMVYCPEWKDEVLVTVLVSGLN